MILAFGGGKRTKLELAGYALLEGEGIDYQPQHLIEDKFRVDAYVPALKLVIEFDGDYWHGHPARFPEPNHIQRRRMAQDRAHHAYLTKCGYRILRIWESDMYKRLDQVRLRLREALLR